MEDDPAEDTAIGAALERVIILIGLAANQVPPRESDAASSAHPKAFISRGSFIFVD